MSVDEFFNKFSDDDQDMELQEDSDGSEYVPTPKVMRKNRRTMHKKVPPIVTYSSSIMKKVRMLLINESNLKKQLLLYLH